MPRISFRGRDLLKLFRWSGLIVFPLVLLFGINVAKTADVIRESNLGLVLLGLALMQVVILLRVWRWKLVAEASGVAYPRFWDYVVLFYTGLFAGAAMPQFAASFAPLLFVSEGGQSWRRAGISILFDRFVELAVLLLFACASAVYLYPEFPALSLAVIASVATVAAGGLVALPALRIIRPRIDRMAQQRWRALGNLLQVIDSPDTLQMVRALRACLLRVGAISALILVLQTVVIVVLAKALGVHAGLAFMVMSWSLVMLAVTLPISIAGLGLREGVLVVMFTATGKSKEEALALGLLFFLVVLVTRLPGALTWLRGSAMLSPATTLAGPAEKVVSADGAWPASKLEA